MKSFIRGLVARVSSSVKAHSAVTATAPPVLGRWGIQYDERIIARKIIQANEDHCGCCVAELDQGKMYEPTEEYLVPYVIET